MSRIPKWAGFVLQILGSVGFIIQTALLYYGVDFNVEPIVEWMGSVLGSGLIVVSGVLTLVGTYLTGRSLPLFDKDNPPSWVPILMSISGGLFPLLVGLLAYFGINFDIAPIQEFLSNILATGTLGLTQLLTLFGNYLGNVSIPIFGDQSNQ